MRTRTLFVASLLAVCSLSVQAQASNTKEVSAADCFEAGMLANDAAAVAQCYAPDAVLWIPGGPMLQGRDAIRDGFVHYLDGVTITSVELTSMGHQSVGGDEVNWGNFRMEMVAKDTGAKTVEAGRFTDVTRKIDGRWMYIVDHASDDPPAAPPEAAAADGAAK